jgi:large subunit ribosomal protein L9
MQIILLERVANLGQLGDVVRVKDGYARNFLIPQGKARRATDAALKEFEARRAELEKVQSDKLGLARSLGERLSGYTWKTTVTNFDVAEGLTSQGYTVSKAMVRMPTGPIKSIGDHKLEIALHHDVVVEVTVSVIGDTA